MFGWLKSHWRNGLRFQIAISILILGGVAALYLQLYNYIHEDEIQLELASVQVLRIENQRVIYERQVCNSGSTVVSGTISRRLLPDEVDADEVTIPATNTVEALPGCSSETRGFALPEGVESGTYRLRLLLTVTSPTLIFTTITSEPFEIAGE